MDRTGLPSRAIVDDSEVSSARPRRVVRPWYTTAVAKGGAVFGTIAAASAIAAFALTNSIGATVAAPPGSIPQVTAAALPAPRAIVGEVLSAPEVDTETTVFTRAYTIGPTQVLAKPDAKSKSIATVEPGQKLSVSTETSSGYRLVQVDDQEGWVDADSLTEETPELAAGIYEAPCNRNKAGFEDKLKPMTIKIYRSVCQLFPDINSIGGWRAGGRAYHKNGRALDFMLTPKKESALGWKIAAYLVEHYKEFDIDHIIFEQKIWTPYSQSWRKMADRGSITANHYNHVHVAVH
ncbi:MAG: SH3 domain-containing protein [Propionibacteriaceae bacterium]|nr:SH3 domain-containing protein [Propionibacteriaceae bacterium]